jgi:FtsH-binding integral membrane protein
VLAIVVRPATTARIWLVVSMIGAFVLAVALSAFRMSFDLDVPRPIVVMAIIGIVACAGAVLEIGWRVANSDASKRLIRRTASDASEVQATKRAKWR